MTNAEAYRTTLAQLQRDRAEAVKRISNLDAAIAAISELLGVQGEMTATLPMVTSTMTGSGNGHRRDPRLASPTTTMKDAALMALETAGKPLRVRELYDLLITMGFNYSRGFDAFRGSMTPTLERRPEFEKIGPGLYTISQSGKDYLNNLAGGNVNTIAF